MLSRYGLLISPNEKLSKKYTITVPIPPFMLAKARQTKRFLTPEKVSVYLDAHLYMENNLLTYAVGTNLLLPRWAAADINLTAINLYMPPAPDITISEFGLELLGNQELVINYINKLYIQRQPLGMTTFLLQLSTGYGKTYVAAAFINLLKKKTLWVIPTSAILDQTKEVLDVAFPTLQIGIWTGDHHDNPDECDILLVISNSLLSLLKNGRVDIIKGKRATKQVENWSVAKWMSNFGITIFDEVHLYCGQKESQIFWHFSANVVLAMSATVDENQKNMDQIYKWHFGAPIYAAEIPGFHADDIKWNGHVHAIKYKGPPEFTKVIKNVATDTVSFGAMVEQVANDPVRNELILEWIDILIQRNHNIFIFCEHREYAALLAKKYSDKNKDVSTELIGDEIVASVLRGGATQTEIDAARKTANVIFTTYAFTSTGVSIVRMSAIIFATPRRNGMTQIIGRIERRGGDVGITREIVDIIDDNTPLKGQFNTRKLTYKNKDYKICLI